MSLSLSELSDSSSLRMSNLELLLSKFLRAFARFLFFIGRLRSSFSCAFLVLVVFNCASVVVLHCPFDVVSWHALVESLVCALAPLHASLLQLMQFGKASF